MLDTIKFKTEKIRKRIITFRREIHRHPELSGQEKATSTFIAGVLDDNDIEVTRNVGGFGVVGILRGAYDGPTIALRADMDALPIQDQKTCDYTSRNPGVMHACGHDVHVATLMGAAITLADIKDELKGNVKFIFQPAEESAIGGAVDMIREGALNDPSPEAILALHCFPEMKSGTIGHNPGMMTASADEIRITVKGRSGHASRPHQTIDAVHVSAILINAIHHIVSRQTDPLRPAVISIGTIRGGAAVNIVADKVVMEGTVRTLDTDLREMMPKLIEDVVKGITSALGADYEFLYDHINPPVFNDPKLNNLVKRCAEDVVGPANTIQLPEPMMGAEDFALFMENIPGVLFRLGVGNPSKNIDAPLHSAFFDIDEDAIITGATMFAWLAYSYLNNTRR